MNIWIFVLIRTRKGILAWRLALLSSATPLITKQLRHISTMLCNIVIQKLPPRASWPAFTPLLQRLDYMCEDARFPVSAASSVKISKPRFFSSSEELILE